MMPVWMIQVWADDSGDNRTAYGVLTSPGVGAVSMPVDKGLRWALPLNRTRTYRLTVGRYFR